MPCLTSGDTISLERRQPGSFCCASALPKSCSNVS
jgi:hypothetical protein